MDVALGMSALFSVSSEGEPSGQTGVGVRPFAMIDDGPGFQLVPWSPNLEKKLGQHVSGAACDDGGIEWSIGRKRGLGL